jgi:hypothetical protein
MKSCGFLVEHKRLTKIGVQAIQRRAIENLRQEDWHVIEGHQLLVRKKMKLAKIFTLQRPSQIEK